MPKRTDIHHILLIGSGPIVIGQACEFDYAGTQACKALRQEGYKVTLINSNPATIMTDLGVADVTYVEPMTKEFVTRIIEKEAPDAILPTMGGQTALNIALELEKSGVLATYGVELLGATSQAIELAEDRILFRQAMQKLGLDLPKSGVAKNLNEAIDVLNLIGLPIVVRPSFILGGSGSGIAHTKEEFISLCKQAFAATAHQELLLDEALIGWKEFEMEVVRDKNDNCIIVCCIENIDPLGIHTGDSITVAPAQTLTDKEYQKMRDASFAILRAIGVETGGSNVQFAIDAKDGRMVVIEMNPRVSRSSALASKATGFPVAKVAAKLAVGYTLPELSNELSGNQVPASFEPTMDYVVVKIPRFNFEKFNGCEVKLGTQMRSVGEAMSIGRTFQEALLKGMRSMEIAFVPECMDLDQVKQKLKIPGPFRLWAIFDAFRVGMPLAEIHNDTAIDPWFLSQIQGLVLREKEFSKKELNRLSKEELYSFKQLGFSDAHLGKLMGCSEETIRGKREELKIFPVYKRIDSCGAEFSTSMAYLYSTYEEECEARPSNQPKVLILGSGPSRIGQGIEFDYSCVHAIQALKDLCGQALSYETLIINCNPETVSTDYDCADKLYFAPLTAEDVLAVIALEKPIGVIVQYGGQTPLNLAPALAKSGVPILGMTPALIEQMEDRAQFQQFIHTLGLKQPHNITIHSLEEGAAAAAHIGYPLIVRPSFVLGGRAMAIVFHQGELEASLQDAFQAAPEKSVLLEHFLIDAIEVDIDAICDGKEVFIPGILEHIEPAGVHSGDSACSLPPFSLSAELQQELTLQTKKIALALKVVGLINIQFAIQGHSIYVLEVNPRASRTCPFISKATGIDLVKAATYCLMGITLKEQGYEKSPQFQYFAVKEAVLPFSKFDNVDSLLGPEMKSTGEVMGLGLSFAEAYAKAQIASGYPLPKAGSGVILSLPHIPSDWVVKLGLNLFAVPLKIYALPTTAKILTAHKVPCQIIDSNEAAEKAEKGEIGLIISLGKGKAHLSEGFALRRLAITHHICHATTAAGADSIVQALQFKENYSLQSLNQLIQEEVIC
jgi:carbamoyl-phosphate synthase large subunit